ncbi:MAG: NAD(P)/FAD-dependent oxidoreductase [Woeseia sp.]
MTERFDAIVIGAGHNGLVCASYLARAGLEVLCLEAADCAGGMAAPREAVNGYRFAGLAHLAHPVDAGIRKDLELDRHGYQPGVAVSTVALDDDGHHRVIDGGDVSGEGLSSDEQQRWATLHGQGLAFARALRPLFGNVAPRLKDMPFGDKYSLAKLGWNLRFGLGRNAMYDFLRIAGSNIYDLLNDELADVRLKGALGLDAVLGNAMGPRTPGSVLTWLQRLYGELEGPLHVQADGAAGLPAALQRSLEDAGGTLRTGARVEHLLLEDGKATGVVLRSGETLRAARVVSAADPLSTFKTLVGAENLDAMFARRVSQVRHKGVVARLNLALRELPVFTGLDRGLAGQRLLLAPSLRYVERAFNPSKYGECPQHPVLEITIPSVHDASLAPDGEHVMSINVAFVPHGITGEQQDAVIESVIGNLERYAPGFSQLVIEREMLTPSGIEARYLAAGGHWHHGELSMHQSFMMRPVYGAAQYDTPVDGLFLCSAGCHPGGGLTGLPGHHAARRILARRGAA